MVYDNELSKQIVELQTKIDSIFVKSNDMKTNIVELCKNRSKNQYEIAKQMEARRKLDNMNLGLITIRCAKLKEIFNLNQTYNKLIK